MEPIESLRAMAEIEPWWPAELGEPAVTGDQDDRRYAIFPDRRRLLIQFGGRTETYDTGDHRIGGVTQADDGAGTPSFTSQHGLIELAALTRLD